MRYFAIGMIWLGVSAATGISAMFDPDAAAFIGLFGFICALIATMILADDS